MPMDEEIKNNNGEKDMEKSSRGFLMNDKVFSILKELHQGACILKLFATCIHSRI
jgi:hypothetical protein